MDGALAIAAGLGEALPAADHAILLIGSGLICQMQGDTSHAQESLEHAMASAGEAGDPWRAAIARTFLGGVLVSAGRYDEAEPLFEDVLARWQALAQARGLEQWRVRGRQEWTGIALFHLGLVAYARHERDRAVRLLTEAVPLSEVGGDEIAASDPLHYLALIACERNEFGAAARIMADILRRLRWRGSGPFLADGLADVATLAAVRGEFAVAARLFGAAAGLLEAGGGVYSLPARDAYERAESTARARLTEEEWQAAFATGRALPLAQALTEAEATLAATGEGEHAAYHPLTLATPSGDVRSQDVAPVMSVPWRTPDFNLTRREREVLSLLCQRLTDPEIAARLFISPRTASSHVANLLGKLGAANRREAAGMAMRNRLV